MKKPKIYCTLGNTTDNKEVISDMLKAGMRGARINTAYCGFDDYSRWINLVREESGKQGIDVQMMMDIKGPQLRLLTANPKQSYSIEKGIVFPLGLSGSDKAVARQDSEVDIFLNYNIKDDVKEGDIILIENGTIVTRVLGTEHASNINVEVINEGEGVIRNNMGVNVPGRYLNLPHLSEKDKQVIDFSLKSSIDCIALSFVRDEKDIDLLQKYILERKKLLSIKDSPVLMAKIEDKFGYAALEKIINKVNHDKFDFEVMIARGDLFNEMNYAHLAKSQQVIAQKCRSKGVKFMVGTGLLESMKHNPRPTRSEVCDVWNALRDQPDYIMLSAETSNSKYPVLAVNTLNHIVNEYHKR